MTSTEGFEVWAGPESARTLRSAAPCGSMYSQRSSRRPEGFGVPLAAGVEAVDKGKVVD